MPSGNRRAATTLCSILLFAGCSGSSGERSAPVTQGPFSLAETKSPTLGTPAPATPGAATPSQPATPTPSSPGTPSAPATPDPAAAPTVSLTSAATHLNSGAATTLTWNSTNASSCIARGGWNGSRSLSGSRSTGPVNANTTYSLSCSGAGGTAVSMITISVAGRLTLRWQAPTENVDGTPLTDLAGYRIHYGPLSRNYTGDAPVDNPAATSTTISLPSGTYYVSMTAFDAQGNESAYSNEIIRSTL